MAIVNTGYKAYTVLRKVTDDGTNRPLDDNNNLVSETNLAQSIKDNLVSDPDYISPIQDLVMCPVNVPPSNSYNAIQFGYYPTEDVCDKTKSAYQISNASFDTNSLIYNTDDSVAANGWYSDGINKAFWNGTVLSSFQACVITPEPTYTLFGTYRKDDPCGIDYEVFKLNSNGYFYYKSGTDYLLASPYSWFQYDRPEAGEYVWVLQVFVNDYTYSGGEQSSTCSATSPAISSLIATSYLDSETSNYYVNVNLVLTNPVLVNTVFELQVDAGMMSTITVLAGNTIGSDNLDTGGSSLGAGTVPVCVLSCNNVNVNYNSFTCPI